MPEDRKCGCDLSSTCKQVSEDGGEHCGLCGDKCMAQIHVEAREGE